MPLIAKPSSPMLKYLKFIFPFLLLCACSSDEPAVFIPVVEEPEIVNYLALGDSYTIGQSVEEAERFPIQLADRLNEKGLNIETKIIAKTGWRTDNLKQGIEDQMLLDTFDLVSLLIGVNNQFQGTDINLYGEAFTELVNRAIQLAGGKKERVFIVSIPDYIYTPFGQSRSNPTEVSEELDDYNFINKTVADAMGVTYFNITPISRQGLNDTELVATDGLHPSGKMYGLWVDIMWEQVLEKF